MNPIASIEMENGAKIVVELLPKLAPNTVNSFIWLANRGVFDNYPIARAEPGYVMDVSTNAFGKEICRYLIANEAAAADPAARLRPDLGVIAMGGYGGNIAGGEFFFPLAYWEKLDGKYPCFGKVTQGLEEITRIGNGPVKEFAFNPVPGNIMHKPVHKAVIKTVRVETFGVTYPEPERLAGVDLPKHWFMENYRV